MSKKFLIIMGILTVLMVILEWSFSGALGALRALMDLLVFGLLLTVIRRLFPKGRSRTFRLEYARSILSIGGILGVFSLILMSFAVVVNTFFPAALSVIHLTDGKAEIVFVQMSHIGTSSYYESVASTLESLSQSGYQMSIEGVRPGSPENRARFDTLLGVHIGTGTYEQFSSLLGMEAQSDRIYHGIPRDRLTQDDLSIDEIVSLIATGSELGRPDPIDLTEELTGIASASRWPLLSYLMRAILNVSLASLGESDLLLDRLDSTARQALLTERNEHVIDAIRERGYPRTVIVYGALHFEGMYAYLRSLDPSWQVTRLDPLYPYVP